MADSLADMINRVTASPQTANPVPVPQQQVQMPTPDRNLWQRMGDYIKDTNLANVTEAVNRINPATALPYAIRDIAQGTFIDNSRLMAAQGTRFPTNTLANVVGAYPGVSGILQMTGARDTPLPGAETLGNAADAINQFGRDYAAPIAGRELPPDELLRGTPVEMAGNMGNAIAQIAMPLPPAWVARMTGAISKIDTGSKIVNKAGEVGLKTLEALTPFAVSAKSPGKTAAINAAIGVPAAVAGEAAVHGAVDQARETRQKSLTAADAAFQQSNDVAKQGLEIAYQGLTETGVTAPKPVHAGITTGSDLGDAAVVLGTVGLFGYYNRDLVRRAANDINRAAGDPVGKTNKALGDPYGKVHGALTGYKPDVETEQSFWTMQRQQRFFDPASQEMTQYNVRKELGDTPAQAREFVREQNEARSKRQGASAGVRKARLETTGEFVDSTVRLNRPANDFAVEVAALKEPRRDNFNKMLHYLNEVDHRESELRRIYGSGNPWTGPRVTSPWAQHQIAHNLPHVSTTEMQQFINGIRTSDPDLARLANEYREIMVKHGLYAGEQGRFSRNSVSKFLKDNPHFVPDNVDESTSLLSPLKRTIDPSTGQYRAPGALDIKELGDPVQLLGRYSDEIIRSTEGKKVQRDFMNFLYDARAQGSPMATRILGREGALDPVAAKKTLKWRDKDGNLKYTEIKDEVLLNSLKGMTNPSALQLTKGGMNTLARWTERGSVGVESLVAGGQVFPVKSALYAITGGTVFNRPPGVRMGWGDVAVNNLTGGKFGLRGDMPGMIADTLYRAPKNMLAVTAQYAGNAVHNALLRHPAVANSMPGDLARQFADGARKHFMNSDIYVQQRAGLMGPSTFDAVDRARLYKDASGNFQVQGFPAMTFNYIQDMMHAISAAPQMGLRAMNKHLPDWKVDSAIRNMSGDPGRSGAFRKVSGEAGPNREAEVWGATPWGNVFLQSNYKLLSGFNLSDPKEFSKVAATIFTTATMPAIMDTMWNASLGPEYSEYQFHTRTPDKRASSYYIGIPGRHPAEGVEFPIEPGLRPFKLMGEIIAGYLFGAYSGELFTDQGAEIRKAMGEAVWNRDVSLGKDSVGWAALAQSFIPPVPSAAEGVGAFLGVQVRDYGDIRPQRPDRKVGFSDVESGDPRKGLSEHFNMAKFEDIAQAVGGTAAESVIQYLSGFVKDVKSGYGAGEAVLQQGREYVQKVKDSTDVLGSGPLLDNARAITPSTAASSVLARQKGRTMTEIISAVSSTADSHGQVKGDWIGSKKGGYTETIGRGPPGPPDQATLDFGLQVKEMHKQLQPALTQMNNLYTELSRIQNDNSFKPDERRAYKEGVANKIIELNKGVLADQRRYEQILSQDFGVQVSFDNFDKNQSVLTQYPPLFNTMKGR